MTYNFRDEPTPTLPCEIDAAGGVMLAEGSLQGDLLTEGYTDNSVQVSIVPPQGWSLTNVSWSGGTGGVLTVPAPGVEDTHSFNFTISSSGESRSGSGTFKVKKTTTNGGTGGG